MQEIFFLWEKPPNIHKKELYRNLPVLPVVCVADSSRWPVAGSLHNPVSKNVRQRLLCPVMEKPDYSCQKAGDNAAQLFVSMFFKGICSLIRYRKQLTTCWWEPMEKNTLFFFFYQLCVPYPWWRSLGVGIDIILGTAALR